MTQEVALRQAYNEVVKNLKINELRVAYIVALVLVPAGFVLDYIYYNESFSLLIFIRAICILILLALYFLSFTKFTVKYIWIFIILWSVVINTALCFMIYYTEGVSSSYYAGLNLVVIGAALVLPLTFSESVFILFSTLVIYLITIVLFEGNVFHEKPQIVFNNFYFITLTGVIGAIASYLKERQRFREFSLRYELDKRNKELSELDRIKSNFFANISHELRTPLTLILSPVEDLLQSDQPFDFRVNQLLTTARDNSYRLLKLVNDILSLVRLDESDKELNCKPIDIQPLLRSIVNSMQHLAEKQKISLRVNSNFTPAVINGDLNALEKIFINIINNAIKFTPENGEILINNEVDDEYISITISDTGIGISEEDLPNIFDRFQQADSSATRKYQGTGLGLALVRELTLAQKGRIDVKSQLNKGTIMTLFFPNIGQEQSNLSAIVNTSIDTTELNSLEKLHQKADYILQLNSPDTATLEPSKQKERSNSDLDSRENLLIVEDEPDLRTYLVNTLSNDYRVFSAADGQAGLELVTKYKPDLVLLDLMLPKIDGLTLCKTIKNNSELKFTKVVLLTARIDEQSKLTALENGADDFLTKPFSTTELKTRLRNLSDSLQLEKDLQVHNSELVEALANLKAAESKLLHSEKLSAIGSLSAGLLHEVNNPLNYTITAAQILKRDPSIKGNDDMAEMVDDIIEGMDRIKAIVKDLHTFAYPDEVDKEQVFLLADAVRSALRFTASEKGSIHIEVDIPDQLEVLGSISHIVQVLVNLIINATKAIHAIPDKKDGSIVITAKTTLITKSSVGQDSAEPRVLVSVRDNGTGIEQETISRIFEPFYTTRDVGEGLGMGLSICHTIIRNHGGTIDVKSNVEDKVKNSANKDSNAETNIISNEKSFTEFSFDLAAVDA